MMRRSAWVYAAILASALTVGNADAGSGIARDELSPTESALPTLAPFQHVRFCLRYPADCSSNQFEDDHIVLNTEIVDLLDRINRSVNGSIVPTPKSYGSNLAEGWTIAPTSGDCNDYAVTKRHELLQHGLPARALRLAAVRTASGIGHLVLVVATSRGDLVLDNLTDVILAWRRTPYQWLKIQSATDATFWYEVRGPGSGPRTGRRIRLAGQ